MQQEKVEKAAKEKAEKAEKAAKEKEEKERLKNMTPEDRKKEAAKKKEEEKLAKANAPPAPNARRAWPRGSTALLLRTHRVWPAPQRRPADGRNRCSRERVRWLSRGPA